VNTYAIAQTVSAVRATVERMRAEGSETDADALLSMIQSEAPEFSDVMAALCRAADEAASDRDAVTERIRVLQERSKRHDSRLEAYRALIFAALDTAGQTKWKSPEFTVSITPGRAGVVITDPEAIPDAFVRIKREPDKTAIGAAIASGAEIPGADLRNGAPSLVIRSK